jgi:hypothetical protein
MRILSGSGQAACLVGAIAFATAVHASAATVGKKLVAVLPLDTVHTKGHVDADAQASLEEMLRDVATNELEPSGWTVLTGETMLQVLTDNGVDPAKCGEESCFLGTAREIDAGVFISGSLQFVDNTLTASIRLIETAKGKILSSVSLEGKSVTTLRDAFLAQAPAFFARSGLTAPAPPPAAPGQAATAHAQLLVHVTPADLGHLALHDPDGADVATASLYQNDAAKPGHWKVTAGAHGFARETQDIDLLPGVPQKIEIVLKPLGGLTVAGSPHGARVDVAGPRDFHSGGPLPWTGLHLHSGPYHVSVANQGFETSQQDITVAPATQARLEVNLQRLPPSPAAEQGVPSTSDAAPPSSDVQTPPAVVEGASSDTQPSESTHHHAHGGSAQRTAGLALLGLAGASAVMCVSGYGLAESAKSAVDAETFPIDATERQQLVSRGQMGNALGVTGLVLTAVTGVTGLVLLVTSHR